jgi:tetraacyldisaccharide 4'-kinase
LFSPAEFRALASGERRGPRAAALRCGLRAAEIPYALAVRWRNYGFDHGYLASERVGVPVVSVGNLTLGGTGKTPLVAWIARWLRERSVRVTLISRGYGAVEGGRNDEALELELKLPDVPHLQNPDRASAAHTAILEFECQAILLDDGFQHRRLARNLDIVLLDALEPFGYGHVFPRGMLREPVSSLRRAHAIALSRADMVSAERRAEIHALAARHNSAAAWIETRHAPHCLRSATGGTALLEALAGQRVAAFCGIGNPAGFRHTLTTCGYDVAELREFPDHHAFTREDVESLARFAQAHHAAALVCTGKDLVKLGVEQIGGVPLWAVEIGLEILAGQDALEDRLRAVLPDEGK